MPRAQHKYHYIYKTTCQVTARFYIGMHSTSNLEDGYLGSGKVLWHSRRKHGDAAHIKEVIEYLPSRAALVLREKALVNSELLADPLNMNLKYGGAGGFDHINLPGDWRGFGNLKSSDVQAKIRAKKAIRMLEPEYHQKVCENISKGLKRIVGFAPFAGRKHRPETLDKMSKSHLGKQDGEKNSQFGTCWINKDGTPMKIRKSELEMYLQQGFKKGRKIK